MDRNSSRFGVAFALAAFAWASAASVVAESNRIVLRVNNRIATLYDYEKLKRENARALSRSNLPEEERQRRLAGAGVEVMSSLFEEMLLLSRADQLDVRVAPSALQEALENTKTNFGISTDAEFDQALRQSGMTRDDLRRQVENSLRMREVFGLEVYAEITFGDEDLRRYYSAHPEEFTVPPAVNLREVVVLDSAGQEPEEQAAVASRLREAMVSDEAEAVLEELEAQKLSTGWIELGWVEKGDLDPQLQSAVEGLEAGSVSEPTRARGGLHLLQVVERREEVVQDFAEVREQLEVAEQERRFQKRLAEYMRELEDAAYIVSNPPPDAAGFRVDRSSAEAESDSGS